MTFTLGPGGFLACGFRTKGMNEREEKPTVSEPLAVHITLGPLNVPIQSEVFWGWLVRFWLWNSKWLLIGSVPSKDLTCTARDPLALDFPHKLVFVCSWENSGTQGQWPQIQILKYTQVFWSAQVSNGGRGRGVACNEAVQVGKHFSGNAICSLL